jgi:hypothetical protein
MKRMVVVSDFHSGHDYGLTSPAWWRPEEGRNAKIGKFQRELWKFYTEAIDSLRPINLLLVNGDCLEGKGESSGGVELITPDRHDQVRMAADAIEYADAECVRILYGTRRHVGKDEDFESVLADSLKGKDVKVQGHAFLEVNGCGVDIKHKLGGSPIPHGRMTAIARARLWNLVWNSEHERQPKADILIRSHVHYFGYAGGESWLGVTTPALTYNSSFGVRECEGLVDVGLLVFDFDEEGNYTWNPVLAEFDDLKVLPESI